MRDVVYREATFPPDDVIRKAKLLLNKLLQLENDRSTKGADTETLENDIKKLQSAIKNMDLASLRGIVLQMDNYYSQYSQNDTTSYDPFSNVETPPLKGITLPMPPPAYETLPPDYEASPPLPYTPTETESSPSSTIKPLKITCGNPVTKMTLQEIEKFVQEFRSKVNENALPEGTALEKLYFLCRETQESVSNLLSCYLVYLMLEYELIAATRALPPGVLSENERFDDAFAKRVCAWYNDSVGTADTEAPNLKCALIALRYRRCVGTYYTDEVVALYMLKTPLLNHDVNTLLKNPLEFKGSNLHPVSVNMLQWLILILHPQLEVKSDAKRSDSLFKHYERESKLRPLVEEEDDEETAVDYEEIDKKISNLNEKTTTFFETMFEKHFSFDVYKNFFIHVKFEIVDFDYVVYNSMPRFAHATHALQESMADIVKPMQIFFREHTLKKTISFSRTSFTRLLVELERIKDVQENMQGYIERYLREMFDGERTKSLIKMHHEFEKNIQTHSNVSVDHIRTVIINELVDLPSNEFKEFLETCKKTVDTKLSLS
jgi:hypothetical protein